VIDLVVIVAIVVLLGILFLSNITGTNASIDNSPGGEIINSQTEFDSSPSAIITIT